MISAVLFIIIGIWLNAPSWYFALSGTIMLLKFINFGISMYKAGLDN